MRQAQPFLLLPRRQSTAFPAMPCLADLPRQALAPAQTSSTHATPTNPPLLPRRRQAKPRRAGDYPLRLPPIRQAKPRPSYQLDMPSPNRPPHALPTRRALPALAVPHRLADPLRSEPDRHASPPPPCSQPHTTATRRHAKPAQAAPGRQAWACPDPPSQRDEPSLATRQPDPTCHLVTLQALRHATPTSRTAPNPTRLSIPSRANTTCLRLPPHGQALPTLHLRPDHSRPDFPFRDQDQVRHAIPAHERPAPCRADSPTRINPRPRRSRPFPASPTSHTSSYRPITTTRHLAHPWDCPLPADMPCAAPFRPRHTHPRK